MITKTIEELIDELEECSRDYGSEYPRRSAAEDVKNARTALLACFIEVITERDTLQKSEKWISREKRLPEIEGKYLASDGSHVFTATYGSWKTVEGHIGHSWVSEVSWPVYYWQPLPFPPIKRNDNAEN